MSDVRATTQEGEKTQLALGEPVLLLVFDPECGHCRDTAPLWAGWVRDSDPGIRVVAVTSASAREGAGFLASFGLHSDVWVVDPQAGALGRRPLSTRTPWVFLLNGEGIILAEAHGSLIKELAEDWSEMKIVMNGATQP